MYGRLETAGITKLVTSSRQYFGSMVPSGLCKRSIDVLYSFSSLPLRVYASPVAWDSTSHFSCKALLDHSFWLVWSHRGHKSMCFRVLGQTQSYILSTLDSYEPVMKLDLVPNQGSRPKAF